MGFKEIALPLAAKGVPTTPVKPNSKAAFLPLLPNGEYNCTTVPEQIMDWDAMYPGHNGAAVALARPDGVWFLEVDSPEVVKRIEEETGQHIPVTYRVRSRPGRGHFYWKQSAASIAMGNINQAYVKNGDWSARVNHMYVVAAGSIHPHSQQPYVALDDNELIECPDWLVAWCITQKITKQLETAKVEPERDAFGLIPHGSIHGYMLREAGRLRQMGLDADSIYPALSVLVHKNCAPPINEDKIKLMAKSICNFEAGTPSVGLLMSAPGPATIVDEEADEEILDQIIPYPKFPTWVMTSTSIYENFVKPVCDVNSRIDYFMWMPAMIMLLNYVSPRILIKGIAGDRQFKGNIYNILIGDAERALKSSSINDAMEYFNYMGCLVSYGRDLKAAEGRIITNTVGSMESLGLAMQKTTAKSALLIYDELKTLVSKAGIEGSSMSGQLLTVYEGNAFKNGVKSAKDTFNIEPPHCISLIACNPVDNFTEQWSKLAGATSGMDSRFTLTLQPELMPEPRIYQGVDFKLGSIKTRQLIDKALNQGTFAYEDVIDPRLQKLVGRSNRLAARAEKWALALAIDLGLTEIDGECIDRAVAIVEYEEAVKAYISTYEAKNKEAQLQQEILRTLRKNRGKMTRRELEKKLDKRSYGTTAWKWGYGGLIQAADIHETGSGKKGDPLMVVLGRFKG